MLVEELGRHFAIASSPEAEDLASGDHGFWNVISLIGPNDREFPAHHGAKSVYTELFTDIEDPEEMYSVKTSHIQRIFDHVDALDFQEPLLIHCAQGLGRSPAVTLGIMARSLYLDGEDDPVPASVEILRRLRPVASPNLLAAKVALGIFLRPDTVETAVEMLRTDEQFTANRFKRW